MDTPDTTLHGQNTTVRLTRFDGQICSWVREVDPFRRTDLQLGSMLC
jgi:hypothetical protein